MHNVLLRFSVTLAFYLSICVYGIGHENSLLQYIRVIWLYSGKNLTSAWVSISEKSCNMLFTNFILLFLIWLLFKRISFYDCPSISRWEVCRISYLEEYKKKEEKMWHWQKCLSFGRLSHFKTADRMCSAQSIPSCDSQYTFMHQIRMDSLDCNGTLHNTVRGKKKIL